MLGRFKRSSEPVYIIGGGFAGLSLAWRLVSLGKEVVLHEKESSFGGLIGTDSTPYGLSERAANSLLVNEPVAEFCNSLELELESLHKQAHDRFILRDNQAKKFPLTMGESLQLARNFFLSRSKRELNGPDMGKWAAHHLGAAALQYLVDPGLSGIYAASPEQLSAELVAPALQVPPGKTLATHLLNRRLSSKKKKFKSYMAIPAGGMGTMTDRLVDKLKEHPKAVLNTSSEFETLPAVDNIVLCTPAGSAARLVHPHCSQTGKALESIQYAPLVSLTLGANASCFESTPQGTGILMPSCEKRKVLGILYCSSSFPSLSSDKSNIILRIFIGGTRSPEVVSQSDEQLLSQATEELSALFGFKSDGNVSWNIYRWPQAIPLYSPELKENWNKMKWTSKTGNLLFGNYTGKVSLRGMVETLYDPSFERMCQTL